MKGSPLRCHPLRNINCYGIYSYCSSHHIVAVIKEVVAHKENYG